MGEAAPAPPPFTGDAQLKSKLLIAASAFALVPIAAPASAQHQQMPGMPMPAEKHETNKPATKQAHAKKAITKAGASERATEKPDEPAQPRGQDDTATMEHGAPAPAMDHSQMGHDATPMPAQPATGGEMPMPMAMEEHAGH